MSSYQISVSPTRRAAARFIEHVRRSILHALAEESSKRGITQSDIAREIGIHRSVINRELRGYKDISVGRVAEIAQALGRDPFLELRNLSAEWQANVSTHLPEIKTTAPVGVVAIKNLKNFEAVTS